MMSNLRRYVPITLVAAIGILFSIGAFFIIDGMEFRRAEVIFQRLASDRIIAVQQRIHSELTVLKSVVAFYQSSNFVDREEFATFSKSMELNKRSFQALEWIPYVRREERSKYVTDARRDGLKDFQFTERSPRNELVTAADRNSYFPVYYVEPIKGNEAALGFDLGSNRVRRAALEMARDSGELVASSKINLVQAKADKAGVLIFAPIYKGGTSIATQSDRRKYLEGFALAVFRVSLMVSQAFKTNLAKNVRKPSGVDLYLFDIDDEEKTELLYIHNSRTRKESAPVLSYAGAKIGSSLERDFLVGGRQWTIVAKPVQAEFGRGTPWLAWAGLLAALAITGVLAAYLMKIINQQFEVTRLVEQRTEELSNSTKKYKSLFENANDGIVIRDSLSTKIIDVNDIFLRRLGYERDEIIGASVDKFSPLVNEQSAEEKKKLLAQGTDKVIEWIHVRKDGTEFPVSISNSKLKLDGRDVVLSFVRDITERKLAEIQKDEFVSTVSHELRTPLTSIKGSLGLIQSGTVGNLPDQVRNLLDIAYNNSERLTLLINDILDMEKIEAGKMDFHLQPMNIVSLINKALEANKGYGDAYDVAFVFQEPPEEMVVNGDEDRLMQVMANLMSNAAKFSPKGGQVELSISEEQKSYRIGVTDFGSGIPEDFRDRIFDKFSQVDGSNTRQKGGTGLGLSISQAIVMRHGGIIDFTTESDRGTTFFVDLPKFMDSAKEANPFNRVPGKHRVLICEDEQDIATLLNMLLQQDGFETSIARNAQQAKDMLAGEEFDFMTLDLGLPDQDGISLIQELRADQKTRELPIVVVSAKAIEGKKALNGDAIGIIDWLQKPIDPDRLRDRLRFAARCASGSKPRILHVEDDPDVVNVVASLADDTGEFTAVATLREAKRILDEQHFDLVILDLILPDGAGEDLLPYMKRKNGTTPSVIVFSAKDSSLEMAEGIEAALLKSRSTNEDLLDAIRSAVG